MILYRLTFIIQIGQFELINTDKFNSIVTDQGSNFVRLLKQKINKFIDEEDNIDVVKIEEVENEIEQINEELNELKDTELTVHEEEDVEEINIENLKEQEGGKLAYLDDVEDDSEENGFLIKLGTIKNIHLDLKLKIIVVYFHIIGRIYVECHVEITKLT